MVTHTSYAGVEYFAVDPACLSERCDGCFCPVPIGETRCGDCAERVANTGRLKPRVECINLFHDQEISRNGCCSACYGTLRRG